MSPQFSILGSSYTLNTSGFCLAPLKKVFGGRGLRYFHKVQDFLHGFFPSAKLRVTFTDSREHFDFIILFSYLNNNHYYFNYVLKMSLFTNDICE